MSALPSPLKSPRTAPTGTPTPTTLTTCGLPGAVDTMVTTPATSPAAGGENLTDSVQTPPGAISEEQFVLTGNTEALLVVIRRKLIGVPPALRRVTLWPATVLPIP